MEKLSRHNRLLFLLRFRFDSLFLFSHFFAISLPIIKVERYHIGTEKNRSIFRFIRFFSLSIITGELHRCLALLASVKNKMRRKKNYRIEPNKLKDSMRRSNRIYCVFHLAQHRQQTQQKSKLVEKTFKFSNQKNENNFSETNCNINYYNLRSYEASEKLV
ncbi:Glutaminyl Cyclase [Sarcoptes scabiei]|nr:Glutaminyl Cyclase [Sarcoptes scabiei]